MVCGSQEETDSIHHFVIKDSLSEQRSRMIDVEQRTDVRWQYVGDTTVLTNVLKCEERRVITQLIDMLQILKFGLDFTGTICEKVIKRNLQWIQSVHFVVT